MGDSGSERPPGASLDHHATTGQNGGPKHQPAADAPGPAASPSSPPPAPCPSSASSASTTSTLAFAVPPPAALICMLCKSLFSRPVLNISCGHTFCRACIEAQASGACPVDHIAAPSERLVPNLAVEAQVGEIEVFCAFAGFLAEPQEGQPVAFGVRGSVLGHLDPERCTARLTMEGKAAHEAECRHAPLLCPVSGCGRSFSSAELAVHIPLCPHHACPFAAVGCAYTGSQHAVDEHQLTCEFNSDDGIVQARAIERLRGACDQLAGIVEGFDQRVNTLEKTHAKLLTLLQECKKGIEAANTPESSPQASSKALTPARSGSNKGGSKSPKPIKQNAAVVGPFAQPQEAILFEGELVMPFNIQCIGTFSGHAGPVWSIVADENLMFTTGSDNTISVWDLTQPGRVATLKTDSGSVVHSLAIFGGSLYSGDSERTVHIWDLETLTLRKRFTASEDIVCNLACTDKYLFTASFAKIKVWNIQTLELVKTLGDLDHWVRALVLGRDGALLYSSSHNLVHIWDAASLERLRTLTTQHGSVHSLAVTDRYIICGTYNQNIHLHDLETHEHIQELMGHVGTVHALATSTKGMYLVSCSLDSSIKIWNLQNMLLVQTLNRHEASINSLLWHSGLLLSGSADKTVKVYKPFKGKVFDVHGGEGTKPVNVSFEACWGSAQLPPRIPIGKRKSVAAQGALASPGSPKLAPTPATTPANPAPASASSAAATTPSLATLADRSETGSIRSLRGANVQSMDI